MASPTQWTWVWVNSRNWWWTRRPGVLWFTGSQGVRHRWVTELNWTEPQYKIESLKFGGKEASIALPISVAAKSLQLCPTLCYPIDGSPPGSSVPGILQATVLEWVTIAFSEGNICYFFFISAIFHQFSKSIEHVRKCFLKLLLNTGNFL